MDTMSNPTCYQIVPNDHEAVIRLVNQMPMETSIFPLGTTKRNKEDDLRFIESCLQKSGSLWASYYRPGAFWEEPVFVCPKCQHATQEDLATDSTGTSWHCKYCDSNWRCDSVRGIYEVKTETAAV